jgi:hypothetical protein
MTPEQHERVIALADEVEAEKRAIEAEIKITDFGVNMRNDFEMTTRHGEHWHKVVKVDCGAPTVATMRVMLVNAVALHARRMPKHQEFAALAKEVAA